jgi:hypothetical protein
MWFGDGDRWRSECGDRHSSQRTGCRKGGKGERDIAPRQTRTRLLVVATVPRPGLGLQARSPFRVAATDPYPRQIRPDPNQTRQIARTCSQSKWQSPPRSTATKQDVRSKVRGRGTHARIHGHGMRPGCTVSVSDGEMALATIRSSPGSVCGGPR